MAPLPSRESQLTPFEISASLVEEVLALEPMIKTSMGIPGADHLWGDLSPDGVERLNGTAIKHRDSVASHLEHPDEWQRHAAVVLKRFLDTRIEEVESGDHLFDVSHVYCGFTQVRNIFDIMDRSTAHGWSNIAARLRTIGEPWEGWRQLLQEGLDQGTVSARRQVESIIEQAENLAGDSSMFVGLLDEARAADMATPELALAVEKAREESVIVAEWLRQQYLPRAPIPDGVGEERYVRSAERFLGMVIDPMEVYSWGWDEMGRLQREIVDVAAEIDPELSIEAVIDRLETDPARAVPIDEFPRFVQSRLDQAVQDLEGTHFAVPEEFRRVTVSLAPAGGALGAWYINPSVDWARPGSVWYSLGDKSTVPLWQEVSTAYHEGFPGHHLQVGTSMYQAANLSMAHRMFIWYSGYGEGWALYAERLMDELGYFEKPEYRMGMLASQLFRAVRVVVDIGLHLGLVIPSDAPLHPGESWDYARAVDYIAEIGLQPRDVSESEVKRYLGWPGQAISYKVGEREILDVRNTLEGRPDFDLKDFHRQVLEGGELRLDHLRERMLG